MDTNDVQLEILANLKHMTSRFDKLDTHCTATDFFVQRLCSEVQKTQDDPMLTKLQQASDHKFFLAEIRKMRQDLDARSTAPPSVDSSARDSGSSQRATTGKCFHSSPPDQVFDKGDPKVVHISDMPDKFMGFKIKAASRARVSSVLPSSFDVSSVAVQARTSDNRARFTSVQAAQATLFMHCSRAGVPDFRIGLRSFQVKARYDAPPKVGEARCILSQLSSAMFPLLAQEPKPPLQVDSDTFMLLVEKNAKALVLVACREPHRPDCYQARPQFP